MSSKLEDGDYKGAVRLACSEDSFATIDAVTLSTFKEKHPSAHPDTCFPSVPEMSEAFALITEKEVAMGIKSFPSGSAGGPDGLRPQHLKDLTGESAERGGRELLIALTSFINHILQGNAPLSVCPILFGATLIALRKKEGDIRPIAIGLTLRRLAAKIGVFRVVQSVSSALAPLQLGYGVPSGCEAAARAARQYLESMPSNHVLLKVDFRNAFNSVRRDKILEAVKSSIPELFLFVSSAYTVPSYLMCEDSIILSEEGVQQGDPLGPLLFCLTLHPLLSQLQSELKIFYLDDGTVGGSTESVLHDLHFLESGVAELGLQLNQSKSELICDDMFVRKVMLDEAPSLSFVSCSQATLLGSPIGGQECIDHTIAEKVDMLERMGSRLHVLSSHDALLLLRHSFAISKVLYVLHTAPCFLSPELARFDESLRHLLCVILNVPLDDDSAWLQASLPVRSGGIGIRRSVQLAPSAYLASAACCSELIPQILTTHLHTSSDPHVEEAVSLWQATHDNPPPSHPSSHRQRVWDSAVVEASFNALVVSAPDTQSRARLLAVSCPVWSLASCYANIFSWPSDGR